MESIAYIVALCVGVALMAWYVANEARGTDGGSGFLAVGDACERGADDKPFEPARYRIRQRLTPDRRAGLRPATAQKAYRLKASGRPSYRVTVDEAAEADKEG